MAEQEWRREAGNEQRKGRRRKRVTGKREKMNLVIAHANSVTGKWNHLYNSVIHLTNWT